MTLQLQKMRLRDINVDTNVVVSVRALRLPDHGLIDTFIS
jgi:hypothetical protein